MVKLCMVGLSWYLLSHMLNIMGYVIVQIAVIVSLGGWSSPQLSSALWAVFPVLHFYARNNPCLPI
jgi:hypothetical protein